MDIKSILFYFFENPFLSTIPLSVKILLMALTIGILIGLVEKFKDKQAFSLEIIYIISALFILILLTNSSSQIVDFIRSFADIRTLGIFLISKPSLHFLSLSHSAHSFYFLSHVLFWVGK